MDKKLIIGISLIAVLVVGVGVYSLNQNVNAATINQGAPGSAATKLTFTNNAPTWHHFDAIIENAPMKNGQTQTVYMKGWLKPNGGALTIDLSQILGYSNEKLPPMSLRILGWEGLFQTAGTNPPIGSTSDMNLALQGWSNTLQPGADDISYPLTYSNIPIYEHTSDVTDNKLVIATTIEEIGVIGNDPQKPVHDEKIVTVDPNGRVTITFPTTPILCGTMG